MLLPHINFNFHKLGETFAVATYSISATGTHRINHESTAASFGAVLYGFGDRETYATTAGYRLTPINQVQTEFKYHVAKN